MAESKSNLSELSGLDWLVSARNEIQSFMLDIYNERPMENCGESDPASERRRNWNLFLGAAFSLWRAVFLVSRDNVDRKTAELAEHADGFLKRVIETNAITFTDEKNEGPWSSGYYLNNARYRTQLLLAGFNEIQLKKSISNEILKEVWNETFRGLQKAFERFKSNC